MSTTLMWHWSIFPGTQNEDQPMNPDDTVQASEEVEAEGEGSHSGKRPPVSSTADTQGNSGTRIDASDSPIVVWTLSEGEGNKPSAFSQLDGGGHVVPIASIDYFFMGPFGQKGAQGVIPMLAVKPHESRMTFAHVVERKRACGFHGTTTCCRS